MLEVDFRTVAVRLAYKYWLEKCPQGQVPGREHIDPMEMVAFLPNILLLDVQRGPLDFHFRLVGTGVIPLISRDYTSEWMSSVSNLRAPGKVWTNCTSAVQFAEPVYAYTPYTGPKKDILDVEDLILPLAADGVNVDMLMVVLVGTRKKK